MNHLFLSKLHILVSLCTILTSARADYVFSIQLESFSNPNNTLANGSCCVYCEQTGNCPTPCDASLQICLINNASNPSDVPNCPLPNIGLNALPRGLNPVLDGAWPGSTLLHITINDAAPDQLIDELFIEVNFAANDQATTTQIYMGQHEVAMLGLRYQIICSLFYYGEDCNTFCKDTNGTSGHFSCDGNGMRVCLDGYQNPASACTECIPAEGCSPIGGYCSNPGECLCRSGYSGDNCSMVDMSTVIGNSISLVVTAVPESTTLSTPPFQSTTSLITPSSITFTSSIRESSTTILSSFTASEEITVPLLTFTTERATTSIPESSTMSSFTASEQTTVPLPTLTTERATTSMPEATNSLLPSPTEPTMNESKEGSNVSIVAAASTAGVVVLFIVFVLAIAALMWVVERRSKHRAVSRTNSLVLSNPVHQPNQYVTLRHQERPSAANEQYCSSYQWGEKSDDFAEYVKMESLLQPAIHETGASFNAEKCVSGSKEERYSKDAVSDERKPVAAEYAVVRKRPKAQDQDVTHKDTWSSEPPYEEDPVYDDVVIRNSHCKESALATEMKSEQCSEPENLTQDNVYIDMAALPLPSNMASEQNEGIYDDIILRKSTAGTSKPTKRSETDYYKPVSPTAMQYYITIVDFIPEAGDEHSIELQEGQEVEVMGTSERGWWWVRTTRSTTGVMEEGWVPSAFLIPVENCTKL